jgi:hypothetical protein
MQHRPARILRLALVIFSIAMLLTLAACGGSGTSAKNNNPPPPTGTLAINVSDDPTEDWAMIGVKVQSIALTPQGGGTPVTVYTAPNPPPVLNLVQLDQLGDLLASAQVAPGTYVSATLTLSANPGDVSLVVSPDPTPGFAGTAGATIPANQIQIVGTQGSPGSLTVPLRTNFSAPLVVTANQTNVLDLEFDLAHPAFLVDHVPPTGPTIWSVNFNPAFRHHPIDDIARFVLRHLYGTVSSVAADNSSITIMRNFPVEPATNPETAISTSQSLTILADATNGTIFYDLDARTSSVIKNFSAQASTLPNKFVRVAARYQPNGGLVAVRIWASATFAKVWLNPEGMVLHVNTSTNVLTVANEDGTALPITINGSTAFFFRTPANALADATPIGTGTGFLSNIVRGFKVHISVVDPLAVPLVAQTVDIETAAFGGSISSPTNTAYTYTRVFHTPSDNYIVNLDYVSSNTPNGKDPNGNPITGYKWWNFTFPTLVDSGANAIPDFVAATGGTVNFGGTAGTLQAFGGSYAVWGNSANPSGWSSLWTVLTPSQVPLANVTANWVTTASGGNFGITVPNGGVTPVMVNLSSVSGSATLVYQVDRSNGIVTVSPQDITTSGGLNNIASHLVNGTRVKVFGVPQADGTIKAYVVFYFTGTTPIS